MQTPSGFQVSLQTWNTDHSCLEDSLCIYKMFWTEFSRLCSDRLPLYMQQVRSSWFRPVVANFLSGASGPFFLVKTDITQHAELHHHRYGEVNSTSPAPRPKNQERPQQRDAHSDAPMLVLCHPLSSCFQLSPLALHTPRMLCHSSTCSPKYHSMSTVFSFLFHHKQGNTVPHSIP